MTMGLNDAGVRNDEFHGSHSKTIQDMFSKYGVWPSPATAMFPPTDKFSEIPCALLADDSSLRRGRAHSGL